MFREIKLEASRQVGDGAQSATLLNVTGATQIAHSTLVNSPYWFSAPLFGHHDVRFINYVTRQVAINNGSPGNKSSAATITGDPIAFNAAHRDFSNQLANSWR